MQEGVTMAPHSGSERTSSEGWPWQELDFMLEHFLTRPAMRPAVRWRPAVDVIEEEDEFVLLADIPGISADDVEVIVRGHTVLIRGERVCKERTDACRRLHLERCDGPFERRIHLPGPADPNQFTARYENGVLIVRISKAASW
jgi:HSP20 family protein